MSEIYTRKLGENRQTELPPGYHGSAFRDGIKLHEPTEEIGGKEQPSTPAIPSECRAESQTGCQAEPEPHGEPKSGAEPPLSISEHPQTAQRPNGDPLAQLLGMLKGRIGTEELILILVILLIASDGIGPETLILSLALLAG